MIKRALLWGAALGLTIGTVLNILITIRPFSMDINGAVERLAFALCPLLIIGFMPGTKQLPIVVIAIIGNGIIYGILFSLIASLMRFTRGQD